MTNHETPTNPEALNETLKTDVERLFSVDFANVGDYVEEPASDMTVLVPRSSHRTHIKARPYIRRYEPKQTPPNIVDIASQGLELNPKSHFSVVLVRDQRFNTQHGREIMISDYVHAALREHNKDNFDPDTGGFWAPVIWHYSGDMTQPQLPYDQHFADIVRAYLETSS